MHPFLPMLSCVLIAMGDATAFYLWKHGHEIEIATHRPSIWVLIVVSFLFGEGLAFWLRRFHIHFPAYFALVSMVWVILLVILKPGG